MLRSEGLQPAGRGRSHHILQRPQRASQRHTHRHRVRLPQPAQTWLSSSRPSRPPCRAAAAKHTCSSAAFPWRWRSSYGVGYAAPGTWPHAARDWRGGRVVFPHTTPDGQPREPLWACGRDSRGGPQGEAPRPSAW